MSESTVDDLLNLDFDPDILINLLGKLSLENMPLDVTETLLSLENKTEATMQNGAASNSKCPISSELNLLQDFSPASVSAKEVGTDVSPPVDLEKESFLSSIGLVAGTRKAAKNSKAKSKKGHSNCFFSNVETSKVQHELPPSNMQMPFSNVQMPFSNVQMPPSNVHIPPNNVQELPDEPCLREDDFDRVVKCLFSNFCDKSTFGEKGSFSSAGQSSETFNYPFHELFKHQGKVIDIQLNDLDCSSKLDQTTPILSPSEVPTDSDASFFPVLPQCSQEVLCSDNICVSTDKFVSSPDSGYTSCSSAISPCSPPDSSESQCAFDLFEDTDEDLQSIVAAIVEVENSLRNDTSAPVGACNNIPVLGDSEDPEDHKERILNFLKEPVFLNQSSLKQPEIKDKDSSSSELQPKNIFLSECKLPCFATAKKSLSKSKEWKLGYEFKYASKSDLRHTAFLSKIKLHSEKNKILKQIQEDERALKRIKVIQLLDKKLKRTATDDRENKRRKIQYKDSC